MAPGREFELTSGCQVERGYHDPWAGPSQGAGQHLLPLRRPLHGVSTSIIWWWLHLLRNLKVGFLFSPHLPSPITTPQAAWLCRIIFKNVYNVLLLPVPSAPHSWRPGSFTRPGSQVHSANKGYKFGLLLLLGSCLLSFLPSFHRWLTTIFSSKEARPGANPQIIKKRTNRDYLSVSVG